VLGTLSSTIQSAEPLERGDAGTIQTINKVREIVNDAWKDLDVRRFAIDILRNAGAPQYDDWSKIRAIYDWITQNFYFVLDPVTKEVLMPFPDLLQLGAGDCDEINATAMAVLLGVIGYEPRLVTVAADSENPESFSHVYAEVLLNGNWIPMDAARPGAQIGQAPESWFRREWWSLIDDSHADYSGTGQLDGLRHTIGRRRRLAGLHAYAGLGQDPSEIDPLTGYTYADEMIPGSIAQQEANQATAEFYSTPASSGGGGINWTSILQSSLQLAPQVLQTVQAVSSPGSALRTPVGPGGYSTVAPVSGSALVSNPLAGPNSTILLLLLAGGLVFFMMGKK
jgi:hypothetical protein